MCEEQSHDAAVEARRDLAKRRQVPHLAAIGRYLEGIAYQSSHDT
jgi:hypothetical protein